MSTASSELRKRRATSSQIYASREDVRNALNTIQHVEGNLTEFPHHLQKRITTYLASKKPETFTNALWFTFEDTLCTHKNDHDTVFYWNDTNHQIVNSGRFSFISPFLERKRQILIVIPPAQKKAVIISRKSTSLVWDYHGHPGHVGWLWNVWSHRGKAAKGNKEDFVMRVTYPRKTSMTSETQNLDLHRKENGKGLAVAATDTQAEATGYLSSGICFSQKPERHIDSQILHVPEALNDMAAAANFSNTEMASDLNYWDGGGERNENESVGGASQQQKTILPINPTESEASIPVRRLSAHETRPSRKSESTPAMLDNPSVTISNVPIEIADHDSRPSSLESVIFVFKDHTSNTKGTAPFKECSTATKLFDNAFEYGIVGRKTRMFTVQIGSDKCTPLIAESQLSFERNVLAPLGTIISSSQLDVDQKLLVIVQRHEQY